MDDMKLINLKICIDLMQGDLDKFKGPPTETNKKALQNLNLSVKLLQRKIDEYLKPNLDSSGIDHCPIVY